jgi:DNA-binding CsgD family transcriptional regulator
MAFAADYGAKWPKAAAKITDDLDVLLAFYDFPAEHWVHLRTTSPIESTFATVRLRQRRHGEAPFTLDEADYNGAVNTVREALGQQEFDNAWAEGAALSTEEAIAYAKRGRGERERPTSGWESLTPTERDVIRIVSEGLGNKDIATRLFMSPRTVQTHLTHVYTKLGLASRVQLAQEAARQRRHSVSIVDARLSMCRK